MHSPIGASYWEYEFNDISGANWTQSAYGTIPDDPYELSDGRWAWHIEHKVYYMFMQPDMILCTRANMWTAPALSKMTARTRI